MVGVVSTLRPASCVAAVLTVTICCFERHSDPRRSEKPHQVLDRLGAAVNRDEGGGGKRAASHSIHMLREAAAAQALQQL